MSDTDKPDIIQIPELVNWKPDDSYLFLGEAVTQLGCQVYTEDWPREDYYRFEDQVVQPKGRRLFAQLLETLVQVIAEDDDGFV